MRVANKLLGELSMNERNIIEEHIKEFGCDGNCENCSKYLDDECFDFESRDIMQIKMNHYDERDFDDDFEDVIQTFTHSINFGLSKKEIELLDKRYEEECESCIVIINGIKK